jgi:hypothetical protein
LSPEQQEELRAEIERLEADEYRGQQVAAFLENKSVKEVFDALEASYFLAWKESRDPASREVLHAKASVLDEVKESLSRVAQSGEIATHSIKELKRSNDQI